jgi:putative ABC transport system permease protein
MLHHFITIFFRNLNRQKIYATFNIAGLSIGLTTFILIALLVQYEYSFDTFHHNLDRIYRVEEIAHMSDGDQFWSQTCFPIAENFKNEFPDVSDAVVTRPVWGDYLSSTDKLTFYEPDGLYASPSLFNIFSFECIEGDLTKALLEPMSIVLTDELARKYFPEGSALGQTITIRNKFPFKVTGVIRKLPDNSTLQPSYICNIIGLKTVDNVALTDNWNNYSYYTYLLLQNANQSDALQEKIAGYMLDKDQKTKGTMKLRPFSIIHLRPSDLGGMYLLVALYSMVAGLALFIAAINFINLITAYAETRGKEIGIKKVIGGRRSVLFLQFISESVLLSFISVFLAFLIAEFTLPLFNRIVDRQLDIRYIQNIEFVFMIIGVALVIGFLAGFYPAVYMSSFKPIRFLRFSNSGTGGRSLLRKSLVVIQFVIATFLILTTIMIYRQFTYHEKKELGFSRDNVLFSWIKINEDQGAEDFDLIRERLITEPEIADACISSAIPFNGTSGTIVTWEGAFEGEQINIRRSYVHYDYFNVFNLDILKGRNFSRDIPSDLEDGCILNETAAMHFGWTDPIGKQITDIGGKTYRVIGLVNDHHLYTTILKIPPSIMLLHDGKMVGNHIYSYKLSEDASFAQVSEKIRSIYKELHSDVLFELQLLKDNMDYESLKVYKGMANTIGFFSLITIGIGVIGLLGLVAYVTKRKTKEIGIRKIHGATSGEIFRLLAKEFILLLIISLIIALPLGAVNKFMDPAEIKVDSNPWEYLLAAGLILFISLITISYHTITASLQNPARSLRYE